MKADCIVLGAGMVGISAAIHLVKRGRSVILIDRRGAAEETSYGNTGIIQTEAVIPYSFPRELQKLMTYAINGAPEANWHYSAAAHIAPALFRYWRNSTPDRIKQSSRAWQPLAARCLSEHEALAREAGVESMFRRTGYMKLYRSQQAIDAGVATDSAARDAYGISFEVLDRAALKAKEPHIEGPIMAAIYMPEPVSVGDPGQLGKAYAALFTKLGGRMMTGDARTLSRTADGWSIGSVDGPIEARDVVIALGPWADEVMAAQGIKIPMFVKRGYHMHFKPRGNATLARPVLDVAGGYCLTPMTKGIRLTTGAEFGWRDAEPTPVQLKKVEPMARDIFALTEKVDPEPWMGRRPCLPDMVPMIGPVVGRRGLWADFAHQHWGFTMGPVTGRLLAEMMTGEATFTDPFPYRTDRF
jgi:D-amino-acid dehydrogenase